MLETGLSKVQFSHRLSGKREISHFIEGTLFLADPGNNRINLGITHLSVTRQRPELTVVGVLRNIERLREPFDQNLRGVLLVLQNVMMGAQQRLQGSFDRLRVVTNEPVRCK